MCCDFILYKLSGKVFELDVMVVLAAGACVNLAAAGQDAFLSPANRPKDCDNLDLEVGSCPLRYCWQPKVVFSLMLMAGLRSA